jgi:anthranilate/para-aminobenzoate synthase component I
LIFRNGLIEASINIRSSVIDLKTHILTYQAGGGITLLSNAEEEFKEMTYKHNSYIHTLTR